jgi:molybdopterin-guanine dinucleotide biosynthesis protein A
MSSSSGIGVLLAGGKSSRMGGADKSLLAFAGRPILAHVIERLGPQVADLVMVANTPFLPTDLVRRFRAESGEHGEKLLVARSEAGLHPVFGLWPVSLAAELEAALERGERKAQDWVRAHKAREVFFPAIKIGGRNVDPFFNVNRPDDLAAAEALLR